MRAQLRAIPRPSPRLAPVTSTTGLEVICEFRLSEQAGMLLEPDFGLGEIRAQPLDLAPEMSRVVHLFEMREFVQDDVVADMARRLNKTPIQGYRAAPRAGAPSRTLVSHGHSPHRESVQGGQFEDARWQLERRQIPKMPF